MRISKLMIGVFAVILFTFAVVAFHVTRISTTAGATLHSQTSNVLVADGSDPLPRPWKGLAA